MEILRKALVGLLILFPYKDKKEDCPRPHKMYTIEYTANKEQIDKANKRLRDIENKEDVCHYTVETTDYVSVRKVNVYCHTSKDINEKEIDMDMNMDIDNGFIKDKSVYENIDNGFTREELGEDLLRRVIREEVIINELKDDELYDCIRNIYDYLLGYIGIDEKDYYLSLLVEDEFIEVEDKTNREILLSIRDDINHQIKKDIDELYDFE